MNQNELPNINDLLEEYSDKIKNVIFEINEENILFFKIELIGDFPNPLLGYINKFEEEGEVKYVPTISHVFKYPPADFYFFNYSYHSSIKKAFDEIYYRALDNYVPYDSSCEWKEYVAFQDSPIK